MSLTVNVDVFPLVDPIFNMIGSLFGSLPDLNINTSMSEAHDTPGDGALVLEGVDDANNSNKDEGASLPSTAKVPETPIQGTAAPQTTKMKEPPARERPPDGTWPEREALSFTRSLVFYGTGTITGEHERACRYIMEARALRAKFYGDQGILVSSKLKQPCAENGFMYKFNDDGVVDLYCGDGKGDSLVTVPSVDEFVKDYKRLEVICQDGAMRSYW
jgi:hypothetical protein